MPRPLTIVGLGEALVDVFPDHQALGGAPLNVAVHAHQLLAMSGGGRGVVASRIGRDALGSLVLGELASRGMPADFVQIDDAHPTGRVLVTLEGSEPSYEIVDDVAWDHLQFTDDLALLAAECDAVCFGTLARRHQPSRETIARFLREAPQAVRLYDVNLRQDFYDESLIREGCELATMVKLNAAELPLVHRLLGFEGDDTLDDKAEAIRNHFGLNAVVLTQGAEGTTLFLGSSETRGQQIRIMREPGADSVGAGDACAAGVLVGWLHRQTWGYLWPEAIVQLANMMGAYVASRPGATPRLGGSDFDLVWPGDSPEHVRSRLRERP